MKESGSQIMEKAMDAPDPNTRLKVYMTCALQRASSSKCC
jgi:hypothetical protein